MSEGVTFTMRAARRIAAAVRWVERQMASGSFGSGGPGRGGPAGHRRGPVGRGGFWAEILTSTAADTPAQNRWSYTFEERIKDTAGYGGWAAPRYPIEGTCYNFVEDMNTDTGDTPEGNGVDPDNLDAVGYTFSIQPAPAGVLVWLYPVPLADGSALEFWFAYENGVDGACD